jgi:hypothetical protein
LSAQFRLKFEFSEKKIDNEKLEEKMIEAKFTTEQFENLLKLVSTATWIINSLREEPLEEFSELEQYLYRVAQKEELTELFEYDEVSESFIPSEELENEIHEYIEDYNEEIFWRLLCTSLAVRDLEKELGESTVKKMEFKEKIKRLEPLIEKYSEEFAENGLENLVLLKRRQ